MEPYLAAMDIPGVVVDEMDKQVEEVDSCTKEAVPSFLAILEVEVDLKGSTRAEEDTLAAAAS